MSDTYRGPRPVPDPPERPAPADDVAVRLLRLAGHRPPVPTADAAIVKEAARCQWQRTVRAEKRRRNLAHNGWRLLAVAAAVVAVVASGVWRQALRMFQDPVATVVAVTGPVQSVDGPSVAELALGGKLWSGMEVQTLSGSNVRAALELAGGASLRLDGHSQVRLRSKGVFELLDGALYVDTGGQSIEVLTPFGSVTNVGTRFELRLSGSEGSLKVRVREGAVRLAGVDQPVGERSQLVLHRDGRSEGPTPILAHGEDWEWIAGARPPLGLEEPTVLQVLEWVEAESGLELHLAGGVESEILEVSTLQGALLGGSLLDQVANSLMAARDLYGYRVEGGELWIEPKGEEVGLP